MSKKDGNNLSISDAKGKLHEVAVLYCLCGNVWSNTIHYRSEGEGPYEVYRICSDTLGTAESFQIMEDSYGTSIEIRNKLVDDGLMPTPDSYWNAAWTSLEDFPGSPGDHEKYTGVKDLNSEADVMITVPSGPLGLSLKYGKSRDFTLKSPGKDNLESMIGVSDLDRHKAVHDSNLVSLGYDGTGSENHSRYKVDKAEKNPRALLADKSSLDYRRKIAADIRKSLLRMSSDELKEFVLVLCANPTVFTHYRSLTRTTANGAIRSIDCITEHSTRMADRYDMWTVKEDPSSSTICVSIMARNISNDKIECVARLSVKSRSGPMLGWNGHFVAPMLIEKDSKIKKKLYAFDMDETLFHYSIEDCARIGVVSQKTGNLLRRLYPHEYSMYVKNDDERFDYTEFKSSEIFSRSAKPIRRMIGLMIKLIESGKDVAIVTARTDFDDNSLFYETLSKFGIDPSKIQIFLTGNIRSSANSTSDAKSMMFREILKSYTSIKFWDDSPKNMRGFLELRDEFPNSKLEGVLVTYNPERDTLNLRKMT